jgi:exodeoxyribonuclease VII large subunit
VADLRAATPSNAAELAVPDQSEMREALLAAEIRLNQAMRKKLTELKAHLEQVKSKRIMQTPTAYIDQKRMELDFIRNRLISASERLVSRHRQEFVRLTASLDALSPLKVLSRGYSIATDENDNIIRDSAQMEIGGRLNLRLHKGGLKCLVEDKT